MASDNSSGKRTINNKRFEIEQRLNRIDETPCNLTQMVTVLIVEGKHEPMERRLDQCGD